MRHLILSALCVAAVTACSTPTEAVPGVSLIVDHVASTRNARFVDFQFTVTNDSRDSVWLQACGGVIRPDVAVRVGGRVTDTYSGAICLANVSMDPAAIAPGARYPGAGSVQVTSGATYVLSLAVAQSRSMGAPARRVSGAEFGPF